MDIEHTPGPWSVSGHTWRLAGDDYLVIGATSSFVAQVMDGTKKSKADAYLIAAAPDLAEALDDLLMAIELPGDHCELEPAKQRARVALAKALGEA